MSLCRTTSSGKYRNPSMCSRRFCNRKVIDVASDSIDQRKRFFRSVRSALCSFFFGLHNIQVKVDEFSLVIDKADYLVLFWTDEILLYFHLQWKKR